jgi:hypothetical protein
VILERVLAKATDEGLTMIIVLLRADPHLAPLKLALVRKLFPFSVLETGILHLRRSGRIQAFEHSAAIVVTLNRAGGTRALVKALAPSR